MGQIPDFTALGPTPTPTPSYRRVFPDQSGEIIAGAGARFGQGLEQIGHEEYVRQTNLARAQSANAALDHEIAVKSAQADITQKVASGELPYTQAQQTFQETAAKIPPPQVPNLDAVGTENLQKAVKRNVFTAALGIDQAVRVARSNDFKDQFGANLDKLGKLAGMPGADIEDINSKADAFRPLAREADIPAPIIDKLLQDFKDHNWLNNATQRSMEAKDHWSALNRLEHDLTAKDGFYAGKLDTDRRNAVLRTVINDKLILQNRAEHEQDKREAKAQAALYHIDEQISSGIPATPGMWEQWQGITKGTSAEADFNQRLKDEDTVQKVLRQPIDQQVKYVQDRAAALESQGGTLRDKANLMRLQTAVNQNVNLMQKAPLLFAANRNGTEVQELPLQGLSSPDGKQAITDQISDRMATLDALRKQYGSQVGVQPLLPQETARLSSQLDAASPGNKGAMLVALRGSFNNDVAYQAAMRAIAPHSPVTAIAGQLVSDSSPASTPVWFDRRYAPDLTVPQTILEGEALLNPNKAGKAEEEGGKAGGALKSGVALPDEKKDLRPAFAMAAGDLFRDRPELADAHYAVYRDAYAALLAHAGKLDGAGDSDLQRQALKIALGTTVRFNGNTTAVPAGMDPQRFPGFVRNAVADAAKATGAPADWAERVRGYQLRGVGGLGSGQYELMNGNAPLLRPNGQGKFIIDLKSQYLPGTAGGGAKVPATPLDLENKAAMAVAAEQYGQAGGAP